MSKSVCLAAILALAVASGAASAQSRPGGYSWQGPYVGANVGYQWSGVGNSAADPSGVAGTFCVNEASLGGAKCMRTCTPGTNAPECPGGTACVERSRNNDPATKKFVCEPV